MSNTAEIRRRGCDSRRAQLILAALVAFASVVFAESGVEAAEQYDPFEARPRFHDPFEVNRKPSAKHKQVGRRRTARDPFEDARQAAPRHAPLETLYESRKRDTKLRQANFQIPAADDSAANESPSITAPEEALDRSEKPSESKLPIVSDDSCTTATERPLAELGIGIEPPAGQLPASRAAVCWESINSNAGPLAGARCWSGFSYQWDATSFCHRPLYFEEINLERYGYGCGWCLQPGASAAHFFGTVPALPYLMTVDCPHECIYTLGHYRPGSCPPWRHHWPPCDPLAAAAEGGVLTGLVFLIP